MAGTTAGIGILAGAVVLTTALAAVAAASVHSQRIASAADAAALAAADAASGAVPGVPCERAEEVASAAGAELVACDLEALVATVSVSAPFGGWEASASARAGPPPEDGR